MPQTVYPVGHVHSQDKSTDQGSASNSAKHPALQRNPPEWHLSSIALYTFKLEDSSSSLPSFDERTFGITWAYNDHPLIFRQADRVDEGPPMSVPWRQHYPATFDMHIIA
ncbi:uncharacterized protein ARMOST_07926 [Armillaria ostoyae]|uniref:Uncharacterized protein n=1 Tax=Armillaria ostoyae TaxID=47428 RepID=A0A284R799_ARMOS|nr:uncharacterized protein ARMOST_07926 [Armillaria ostoyae]